MKKNLIFIMICLVGLSCGPSAEESSEQYRLDSLRQDEYAKGQADVIAKQEELASSPAYATDDGTVSEKAKKESVTPNKSAITTKETTYSLTQDLTKLSDTLYLRNVRLSKKFIKTADLKFKTKNVEKATHQIETLTRNLNGYVQQSEISSNVVSGRNIELSGDSMLSVSEYVESNNLIIRVPCIYFDSVLNVISKLHIYLDYRNVKTEDVSTTFLRNKLKAEKSTEYEKRIQKLSDNSNRRLDDNVEAETKASELADKAIDKKIENYELQDRIDFSTISMNIYQANAVFEEKVKNTQLRQYQPSFWKRAWDAILVGWYVILDIIIALIHLWPLYLLAVLIYFGIKYFRKKFMK